ncbi:transcriptional regulator [Streptomyces bingchenggensis BCW-1]|uniref:Transcriptional regulator n=1 Tax=Streptomyces bingchenggensis (strain BCW-1) TaxID=749414 RepID=D7BW52_STRBB|nr:MULTISPECIES: TetR family transcriptional regulator [Streptomyces]ADI11762.1 transcriptional regulator [Streptomyces bingchenggensis BCW-1]
MNLREQKKLAARRAIRTAALQLFDERGFEAVSVEEIAAAVGVSRSTFFNYFAGKEAVVFDQDPEERDHWRALMAARPANEPLWDSLAAILVGFNEILGNRLPLQRRLKAHSPALAKSSWDIIGEQFEADLRAWMTPRTPDGDSLAATLQLNLATAAQNTAYQAWDPGESFDDYLQKLKHCLHQARPAITPPKPQPPAPGGAGPEPGEDLRDSSVSDAPPSSPTATTEAPPL